MKSGKVSFYKVGDATRFRRDNLDLVFEKHTSRAEAEQYGARCVACGHAKLISGRVQSTGKVYFKPSKTKFFPSRASLTRPTTRLRRTFCSRLGSASYLSGSTNTMYSASRTRPVDTSSDGS